MTRAILLAGVPELLVSQGPGHRAPHVRSVLGRWADYDGVPDWVGIEEALPLFWADAPCYPAIHALVRAAEAADTRWVVTSEGPDSDTWAIVGPPEMDDRARLGDDPYAWWEGIDSKNVADLMARDGRRGFWDELRFRATDYAGVLALANEAVTAMGKGRVET